MLKFIYTIGVGIEIQLIAACRYILLSPIRSLYVEEVELCCFDVVLGR
jgi:hypothetical protein